MLLDKIGQRYSPKDYAWLRQRRTQLRERLR